ncbi:Thiamin pyrophosphokinase [Obba rivulosa]|uniref:Thiamine pyrophosphokinase n=1 Tax=Obba rivulosa TaxID=1052685 RepID=A0A8E2DRQ7_9APHY|nr:Thiamin pyrophosphokinase [Obba rivulosa]
MVERVWSLPFLEHPAPHPDRKYALIILNQPFSVPLLRRLWHAADWRACADGGANRLYDVLGGDPDVCSEYLPDIIKGDLDSLRDDVKKFYESWCVSVVHDEDQYSTDLMKCVAEVLERDKSTTPEYDIIILGGLSGRLDQTVHTLSYIHKLRKQHKQIFTVTDDNVAWVLDSGEHRIHINHTLLGKTCGLLPLGVESTVLSTTGLQWNLTNKKSSFDGMVSTSNHLVPEEKTVWIKTTMPIWWTVELKSSAL